MLPGGTVKDWGPTHPLAQIKWTADKNRACNGHYINVVRAMKWWRHEHVDSLPKYPKGYPLEHMIGYVLPDGIESVAEGVTLAFEGIRDQFRMYAQAKVVPFLPDHGVPTHDVLKRLDAADFVAFHTAASAAAGKARRALDLQDAAESGEIWQGLFGKCFRRPVAGRRQDARGFTSPAIAAQPKTNRFA